MRLFIVILVAGMIGLTGCGKADIDDNSPAIFFDNDQQRAERNERRAQSPGKKIYGKMYRFIDASIDGKVTTPSGTGTANLTLENGLIKGFDGCRRFSGRGGFTPSGYEFTTRDSGPFERANIECGGGDILFPAVYELEDRVWRLSLEPNGVLVLTEYEHGKHVFRLRPRNE